jgi:hypothetical protein
MDKQVYTMTPIITCFPCRANPHTPKSHRQFVHRRCDVGVIWMAPALNVHYMHAFGSIDRLIGFGSTVDAVVLLECAWPYYSGY